MRPSSRDLVERAARLIVVALLIGIGIAEVLRSVQAMLGAGQIDHPDLDAYLGAAMRLRLGEPLYPAYPGIPQDADFLYRYAPWFAFAFIPLTYLPRDLVAVAWDVVLIVATFACVWPLLRNPTMASIALAVLFGGFLMKATAFANVHPLMLVPLIYALEQRSGPLWVAVAASLKAFPLLLVLVYVGRRDWRKVAWTLGLTVLLVGPMLAFDLTHYPTESGGAWFTIAGVAPVAWVAITAALSVATLRFAKSRHAWLLAALTTLVASPRVHEPYLAVLTTGLQGTPGPERAHLGQRDRLDVEDRL